MSWLVAFQPSDRRKFVGLDFLALVRCSLRSGSKGRRVYDVPEVESNLWLEALLEIEYILLNVELRKVSVRAADCHDPLPFLDIGRTSLD